MARVKCIIGFAVLGMIIALCLFPNGDSANAEAIEEDAISSHPQEPISAPAGSVAERVWGLSQYFPFDGIYPADWPDQLRLPGESYLYMHGDIRRREVNEVSKEIYSHSYVVVGLTYMGEEDIMRFYRTLMGQWEWQRSSGESDHWYLDEYTPVDENSPVHHVHVHVYRDSKTEKLTSFSVAVRIKAKERSQE